MAGGRVLIKRPVWAASVVGSMIMRCRGILAVACRLSARRSRPGCSDRAADDADVRASKHRVEVRGELVVSVVDEEPDLAGAVAEAHQEAAGLLGDPVGFAGPDAG